MLPVVQTYNIIAKSFDKTRYSIWKCVREYILELPIGNNILEVGCGNGKNLEYLKQLGYANVSGCDVSVEFVNICISKQLNVIECDILKLNQAYDHDTFDNILCVAVIHHLDAVENRLAAIVELINITNVGGSILITVSSALKPFSKHSRKLNESNDYAVDWNNTGIERFYHLFEEGELESLSETASNITQTKLELKSSFECDNWIVSINKM